MASLSVHFARMAYNNAWANHRLLAACSRLTEAEFLAERVSFFPSLTSTLCHILTVDWYYLDALERWHQRLPPNPHPEHFFEPEEPYDSCAALSLAQHQADRRLVALSVALSEERLEEKVPILRRKGLVEEPAMRLLPHLFQHQIHHRGQIHAMLADTSVAPPQLDEFFCSNEAHLRAKELAELGYSEELIWGPSAPKEK